MHSGNEGVLKISKYLQKIIFGLQPFVRAAHLAIVRFETRGMTEFEKDIIGGCIRGDKSYQKKLYDTYSGKMFAVCLRYSNNYEQARDLLQEGFIKVFQNIVNFKGDGSFEGWIRRIMINGALEWLRKAEAKFIHQDVEDYQEEISFNPDIRKLELKDILARIQQLAPGYRAVLNLYVIEGYQHHEIAVMLGISESTSKSQLSRARKVLQDSLAIESAKVNGGR